MGGLRDERFGGSGRGGENELRDGRVETGNGQGSETGPVMKKKGKKLV